ncbi:MAG: leucine-rich repeat protein [Alistipes sp.]|jgi:hypothetical protein|nr:leucine-rich repeat protein [Alistipes sp.]
MTNNVTITNTGTGEVTLARSTSVNYQVGRLVSGWFTAILGEITIPAGESAQLHVRPKTGLAVGTHTETITFSGSNGATASIDAKFTVTAKPAPAGLTVVPVWGTQQLNISWAYNGDVGTGGGFHLERSTNRTSGWKEVYAGTAKSYSDTGLAALTTYYYRVRVNVVSGGTGLWSEYSSVGFSATNETLVDRGMVGPSQWLLYASGTLEIIGIGMPDYSSKSRPPWEEKHKEAIKKVVIEDVTRIGTETFWFYSALESVTILGKDVKTIGERAFRGCAALVNLTIGSGVTSIGNAAFMDCTFLRTVFCLATTPPTLGTGNFTTNGDFLFVPYGKYNTYADNTAWRAAFSSIMVATR